MKEIFMTWIRAGLISSRADPHQSKMDPKHCFIPVSFWNRIEEFRRKIDKLQIKKSKRYKGSQQKRWNIRRPTFINFLLFYFHRGAVISVHWFKRCRELRTNDPTENDVLLNEYISSILLITICMQHTYGNYPNLHYK